MGVIIGSVLICFFFFWRMRAGDSAQEVHTCTTLHIPRA